MGGKGSGGHNKKTIQQHLLEGTYRRHRHGEITPKPAKIDEKDLPVCPSWLDKYAIEEWRRVCHELVENGTITMINHATLEGYCAAYSKAVRAELKLRGGFTNRYKTSAGKWKISKKPEVNIAQDAWKQVKSFAIELGITPASRTTPPKGEKKKDPLEQMLEGVNLN